MKSGAFIAAALAGAVVSAALATNPATGGASTPPPFYSDATLTPAWTDGPTTIGSFSLVDQSGATFTDRDLAGRIHVASFLFTTCPSLCPALVSRLRPVQDALARHGAHDVTLVSYSVTPRIDTPEALAAFGAARGIDPRRWKLLTDGGGGASQIERLMRDSYFAADERGKLLHTERVALVDAQGRLRGVYNGTQPFEMERLLDDIDALRAARK